MQEQAPSGYENLNLGVIGVVGHSPVEVSMALKQIGVSHRIVGDTATFIDQHVAQEQPAIVYLLQSVNQVERVIRFQHAPYIVFVCAAEDELKMTNAWALTRVANLPMMLKSILRDRHPKKVTESFQFKRVHKALDDYVHEATKPTFLYFIQTAIYKLTPYALVKESRELIISALYGAISMKKLHDFLNSSLKLEELKMLLKDDRAKQVRELVLEVRKQLGNSPASAKKEDEVVGRVVASTGLEPFDILYVMRSYQKMARDKELGIRRGRKPKAKTDVRKRRR